MSAIPVLEPPLAQPGPMDRPVTLRDLTQLLVLMKEDMKAIRIDLDTSIGAVRADLQRQHESLRAEFVQSKGDTLAAHNEMKALITTSHNELKTLITTSHNDLTLDIARRFAANELEFAARINAVRDDLGALREAFSALKAANDERIHTVHAQMATIEANAQSHLERQQSKMLKWWFGSVASSVGATAALMKSGF